VTAYALGGERAKRTYAPSKAVRRRQPGGALAHGIPLAIAAQGEDKAEVATRLAWTGVALRRTAGEPAGPDIRAAGGAVFGDPAWRTHARCLQTEL